ncbi:Rv3235 family protein [Streptomyces marispadix]|uniref:Rv3235 family protein n=1 Tax=Streptomyces marispadix TaxID=2922868 RepID=A0ABS9SWL8_9ACTN|nr:Rv3235 family protein [Streptomyces marispadix]MCH6160598.1 Rv3235 family protein [Streptomyces marispadix]
MDAPPTPPAAASPRSRQATARKAPPGRRDSRRPQIRRPETRRPEVRRTEVRRSRPATARPAASPSASALRAAAARERERQPPFWFASRLVLVLSGQRPVHTLLGHTRSSAYEQLAGLASHAPLRPRGADRSSPEVLDARGSRPSDGVIEAFARIVTGDRQRAMAFRLELCPDRRWRCAAVELDGQSPSDRHRPGAQQAHDQGPFGAKQDHRGSDRPEPADREP